MENIGTRAKAARKFAKMTQKQAEAASGVKQSNISKIERGDTTRSMSVLALARVYRVDPNWLDTGDGPAPWDEDQVRLSRDSANEPHGAYRVLHVPPHVPSFNPRTPNTVPLITWEDAAEWHDRTSSQQAQPERWIPCIAHHSLDTYALRIRGDSMTADHGLLKSYRSGSIIFVDTQLKTPKTASAWWRASTTPAKSPARCSRTRTGGAGCCRSIRSTSRSACRSRCWAPWWASGKTKTD